MPPKKGKKAKDLKKQNSQTSELKDETTPKASQQTRTEPLDVYGTETLKMSESDVKNFVKAFRLIDLNKSDEINKNEFRDLLDRYKFGENWTHDDMNSLFDKIDTNQSGKINGYEFLEYLSKPDFDKRFSTIIDIIIREEKLATIEESKNEERKIEENPREGRKKEGQIIKENKYKELGPEEYAKKELGIDTKHYQKYLKAFHLIDTDDNDLINMKEFSRLFEKFGIGKTLTKEDVSKMFAEIDEDEDGDIDLRDFLENLNVKNPNNQLLGIVQEVLTKKLEIEKFKLTRSPSKGDNTKKSTAEDLKVLNMTPEELEKYKNIFYVLASGVKGTFNQTDFKNALKRTANSTIYTPAQISESFNKIDTDKDGVVNLLEFIQALKKGDNQPLNKLFNKLSVMEDTIKAAENESVPEIEKYAIEKLGMKQHKVEKCKKTFRLIDEDGSGELDEKEFSEIITSFHLIAGVSSADIKKMFTELDEDKSGKIGLKEWVKGYGGAKKIERLESLVDSIILKEKEIIARQAKNKLWKEKMRKSKSVGGEKISSGSGEKVKRSALPPGEEEEKIGGGVDLNEIEEYKNKILALEQENEGLKKERDESNGKAAQAERELSKLKDNQESIEGHVTEWKSKVDEMANTLKETEGQKNTLAKEKEELEEQIKQLQENANANTNAGGGASEEEIEKLLAKKDAEKESLVKEKDEKIGKLETKLSETTDQISELKEQGVQYEIQIKALKKEHEEEKSVLNLRMKDLQESSDASEAKNSKIYELDQKINSLEEENGNLRGKEREAQNHVEELQAQLEQEKKDYEAKIRDLEGGASSSQDELKKKIQEIENENSKLLKDKEEFEGRLKELEEKLKTSQEDLNQKIKDFESEKQTLLDEKEELSKKITEFESGATASESQQAEQLKELETQNQTLTKERDDLLAKVKELETNATSQEEQVNKLQAQETELQNEIKELQEKHTQAIDDLNKTIQELNDKISASQEEHNKILEAKETENKRLIEEKDALEANLKEAQSSSGATQDEQEKKLVELKSEHQNKIEELETQFASEKDLLKKRIEELETNSNENQEQAEKLEKQETEHKRIVEEKDQRIKELEENTEASKTEHAQKIKEKEDELLKLTNEKEELSKKVTELEGSSSTSQEEKDKLIEKENEYKNKIQELQTKYDSEVEELNRKIQDLEGSSKTSQEEQAQKLKEKEDELLKVNDEKEELSKRITELEGSSKTSQEEQAQKLKEKETEYEKLVEERDGLLKKIGELEGSATATQEEKEKHFADKETEYQNKIKELQTETEELKSKIQGLEGDASTSQEEQKEKLKKIESESLTLTAERDSLKHQIEEFETKITTLEGQITELKGVESDYKSLLTQRDERIKQLEGSSAAEEEGQKKKLDDLTTEHKQVVEERDRLAEKIKELDAAKEGDSQKLREKEEDFEKRVQELAKEKEELLNKIQEIEEEKNKGSSEGTEKEAALEQQKRELEAQNSELYKKIEQFEEQLSEMRKEIQSYSDVLLSLPEEKAGINKEAGLIASHVFQLNEELKVVLAKLDNKVHLYEEQVKMHEAQTTEKDRSHAQEISDLERAKELIEEQCNKVERECQEKTVSLQEALNLKTQLMTEVSQLKAQLEGNKEIGELVQAIEEDIHHIRSQNEAFMKSFESTESPNMRQHSGSNALLDKVHHNLVKIQKVMGGESPQRESFGLKQRISVGEREYDESPENKFYAEEGDANVMSISVLGTGSQVLDNIPSSRSIARKTTFDECASPLQAFRKKMTAHLNQFSQDQLIDTLKKQIESQQKQIFDLETKVKGFSSPTKYVGKAEKSEGGSDQGYFTRTYEMDFDKASGQMRPVEPRVLKAQPVPDNKTQQQQQQSNRRKEEEQKVIELALQKNNQKMESLFKTMFEDHFKTFQTQLNLNNTEQKAALESFSTTVFHEITANLREISQHEQSSYFKSPAKQRGGNESYESSAQKRRGKNDDNYSEFSARRLIDDEDYLVGMIEEDLEEEFKFMIHVPKGVQRVQKTPQMVFKILLWVTDEINFTKDLKALCASEAKKNVLQKEIHKIKKEIYQIEKRAKAFFAEHDLANPDNQTEFLYLIQLLVKLCNERQRSMKEIQQKIVDQLLEEHYQIKRK